MADIAIKLKNLQIPETSMSVSFTEKKDGESDSKSVQIHIKTKHWKFPCDQTYGDKHEDLFAKPTNRTFHI